MAIYRKGADPVTLRASADRVSSHARGVESLRGEATRAAHGVPVSSFMNLSPDGRYAYVGEWDKNTVLPGDSSPGYPELYRHEVDHETGTLVNQSGPQRIPDNAQGVAVTDGGLLFTTSWGDKPNSTTSGGTAEPRLGAPWAARSTYAVGVVGRPRSRCGARSVTGG